MFSNFLIILVVREKIKVKISLAIRTGASIVVVNQIIDILPVVALNIINICLCNQK